MPRLERGKESIELKGLQGLKESAERPLASLIRRGGFYQGIPGTSPREVLSSLIETLRLPSSVRGEDLLRAVLEREALMSTGIGGGIALPHPRNPLVLSPEEQFVTAALLEIPVGWQALDGKPVDTLFLIVSASSKAHLRILSEINYFCRQQDFVQLLRQGLPAEYLTDYIEAMEKKWE